MAIFKLSKYEPNNDVETDKSDNTDKPEQNKTVVVKTSKPVSEIVAKLLYQYFPNVNEEEDSDDIEADIEVTDTKSFKNSSYISEARYVYLIPIKNGYFDISTETMLEKLISRDQLLVNKYDFINKLISLLEN